jgi:molybdate transport system substrate-binding protein
VTVSCGSSKTTVDVFAASSLTDAFTEFEERFEAAHPDIDIRLNLAGSDTLRRQIDDGADVDVYAPASPELFDGLDAEPRAYASNQLEVVVSAENDAGDLTRAGAFDGLFVARCAAGVPCGEAADRLIETLGLDLGGATVTSEANVRAVLSKVSLGEADVGLVYRTDAIAGGDNIRITGLTAPEASVTLAIATLGDADDSPAGTAAAQFLDFVLSDEATDVLTALGFLPAP